MNGGLSDGQHFSRSIIWLFSRNESIPVRVELEQCLLHVNVHGNHLAIRRSQAWHSALLMSPQTLLMLLVCGPLFCSTKLAPPWWMAGDGDALFHACHFQGCSSAQWCLEEKISRVLNILLEMEIEYLICLLQEGNPPGLKLQNPIHSLWSSVPLYFFPESPLGNC